MKKKFFVILLALVSPIAFSVENHCGKIKTMRTWAQGSDHYGIWVEYENNPAQCPGGFYLQHEASNKQFVYSYLLAHKMSQENVCIQVYSHSSDIGNRCRLHYVFN